MYIDQNSGDRNFLHFKSLFALYKFLNSYYWDFFSESMSHSLGNYDYFDVDSL